MKETRERVDGKNGRRVRRGEQVLYQKKVAVLGTSGFVKFIRGRKKEGKERAAA